MMKWLNIARPSTDIQSILSDINTFNEQTYDDDDLLKELQEMTENEKEQETSTPVFKAVAMPLLTEFICLYQTY